MPYIVNEDITFTFVIEKTTIIKPNLDIVEIDPNLVITFDEEGTAHSAVYVAPSIDGLTDGSYTFTKSYPTVGNWKINIAEGTATSYTIINEYQIRIEDISSIVDSTIIFYT